MNSSARLTTADAMEPFEWCEDGADASESNHAGQIGIAAARSQFTDRADRSSHPLQLDCFTGDSGNASRDGMRDRAPDLSFDRLWFWQEWRLECKMACSQCHESSPSSRVI